MKTSKKTFIVDDDPFWTAILTQLLSDIGFTDIVTFPGGTDCYQNLHLNPGLVFLDYQMEDMNGLDVLQKIKGYDPAIDVVFCTSHEDLHVAIDAIRFGSFDYLLKGNATRKELSSIVSSVLN